MKNILNPKILAITTIITTIIGFILSIILSVLNIPLYLHISQIIRVIGDFVLYGNLYIIIYLLIILSKKQKNIKLLNTILFINLIIAIIKQILYTTNTYSIVTSIENIPKFQMLFNSISNIIFFILETIIVYGILRKKKMPYKVFMIILVSLTFVGLINTIISIFSYSDMLISSLSLLSTIMGVIKSCSFVLFIYLYGKSINERGKNNE